MDLVGLENGQTQGKLLNMALVTVFSVTVFSYFDKLF